MPQSLPGCAPADPAQSARATVKTLLVNVRPTSLMVVPPPWCAVAPVLDARRPCRPERGGLSRGTVSGSSECRHPRPPARATIRRTTVPRRPMAHTGMKFGIFLAPFHRVGENPTLALARDMELIEWLDHLGYDEVWVGEHHSAGWETIASPEVFIAAAAERTRHIMLGSGVTSLPYHHPLMVANRFVLLDHMTRGRTMLGCGPGVLPSDAYMLGIEPVTQRRRMEESLDAILRLLRCDEPVTMKTDWFELREARLHLAPYTVPRFPIVVASTITPFGMVAAGKHGLGVLSIGAGLPGGPEALASQWRIAGGTAAAHGPAVDRAGGARGLHGHLAGGEREARREVQRGERHQTVTYLEGALGRPPGRAGDPLRD